jgi:hypothetical protein
MLKGNRVFKFDINNGNESIISIEQLYNDLVANSQNNPMLITSSLIKVASFNSSFSKKDTKVVKYISRQKFSGNIHKLRFNHGKIFECTSDHVIPTVFTGTRPKLQFASDLNTDTDFIYNFRKGIPYAYPIDEIEVELVEDIYVYNLNFASLDGTGSDIFYEDYESGLIHNNVIKFT